MLRATKTARYLTFEHVEIEGCNWREDDTPSTRLLFFTGDVSHLTLRYCYVHESSSQWMYSSKSTDILIECCYFENCARGMGLKIFGSSDQMNVVIRYTHFENVTVQTTLSSWENTIVRKAAVMKSTVMCSR